MTRKKYLRHKGERLDVTWGKRGREGRRSEGLGREGEEERVGKERRGGKGGRGKGGEIQMRDKMSISHLDRDYSNFCRDQ